MELTLEVIVDLAGDLEDGSRASEKLREKLKEDADLKDVEELLDEALAGTERYHNRALQDIVNNIAQRLGFSVEYGQYQPSNSSASYDGLWSSAELDSDEVYLVAETKKSTGFTINPEHQPGAYMDRLVEENGLDETQVYGIIVVGEDDKLSTIVQSIRGSAYRNRVRVITCERLFGLLSMANESDLSHEQIAQVLLPMDTVNVGSIVELMKRIVDKSPSPSPPQPSQPDSVTDPPSSSTFWEECAEFGIERDEEGNVIIPDDVNGSKALRHVVGLAFDEGYITEAALPYAAGGKTRYLLNTKPVHQNGQDMARGHEVRDGVWVECNRSVDVIERCISRIAEDFVE